MSKRTAVYAGSFDPVTNGHLWMIRKGAAVVDELVVAVGLNPEKAYTFTVDQRLRMLREVTAGMDNTQVASFESKYLVDYARSIGARFILRGIRNLADYSFERAMRHVNHDLAPEITSIFLMPPRDLCEISSSFVKGMIGPDNWEQVVPKYVPEPVFRVMLEKYGHVSA